MTSPQRKFRRERAINRYLLNPLVRALDKAGIRMSVMTEIETTGRKTGRPRRVPVAAAFDAEGAWLISQHGTHSGWGANITTDPRVRLKVNGQWRAGSAAFMPDDDVVARARTFATTPLLAALNAAIFRATQTTPMSVRVTFTTTDSRS